MQEQDWSEASWNELVQLAEQLLAAEERGEPLRVRFQLLRGDAARKAPPERRASAEAHPRAHPLEEPQWYSVALSVIQLDEQRFQLVLTDSDGGGCVLTSSSDRDSLHAICARANKALGKVQELAVRLRLAQLQG